MFLQRVFAAVLAIAGADRSVVDDSAPTPGAGFDLTAEQLGEAMAHAANGDVASVHMLANYYLYAVDDVARGFYWLEKAGDLGDLDSRVSVLGYYARALSPQDQVRAERLRKRWGMK